MTFIYRSHGGTILVTGFKKSVHQWVAYNINGSRGGLKEGIFKVFQALPPGLAPKTSEQATSEKIKANLKV